MNEISSNVVIGKVLNEGGYMVMVVKMAWKHLGHNPQGGGAVSGKALSWSLMLFKLSGR